MTAMSTTTKSKVSSLHLVYPPISNQEAVWMQQDADVEAIIRRSDFYMIASRAEATYQDITCDHAAQTISFRFVVGDHFSDDVVLALNDLPTTVAKPQTAFFIEAGPKMIRIWTDDPQEIPDAELVDWFTTEKLLFDRSHGRQGIGGFANYRQAATYDLLYVGIAKVGDTFDRLIDNGHKARQTILSNEPQRYPGARVSDETYLFAFEVEPVMMTSYSLDHVFDESTFEPNYEHKRIVADAEKAFVSLLKPQYNRQLFKNYPKGVDGLYGSDFDRYGYNLCENLTLNTANGRFRGGRDLETGFISNEGDAIFVEGDTVQHFVSGVDFPADYGAPAPAPPSIDEPPSDPPTAS
ncbi:hypothetical protein [Caulobacter flavus]|uniref:hypothetical protein n=1 Tax=Caulobacter flavus TaxID=1679497 RepID=UPI0011AF436C|nr:hypothetical protein [Caulobacter flavus]